MNNPELIASSVEQYKQIIGALTERSVKTATVLLEQNWRWAMQNLLDQFDWTYRTLPESASYWLRWSRIAREVDGIVRADPCLNYGSSFLVYAPC
jgi:hypothetical protein